MKDPYFEALKMAFNCTALGNAKHDKREEYQKKLLALYPQIGGKCYVVFASMMEEESTKDSNPAQDLSTFFGWLKKLHASLEDGTFCGSLLAKLTGEAQGLVNDIREKNRYSPSLRIPTAILLLYRDCFVEILNGQRKQKASA